MIMMTMCQPGQGMESELQKATRPQISGCSVRDVSCGGWCLTSTGRRSAQTRALPGSVRVLPGM